MASEALLQAIAVTAELTNTQLSTVAARVMAEDLARYPQNQILDALTRCRREIKGKLTIHDVLSRIEDGRPEAEEAWASIPTSESMTVVWTEETAQAFGVAYPLIRQDEMIPARMAFLESYRKLVRKARDKGRTVRWTVSLGQDPHGRETVLLEAARLGRVPVDYVQGLLPYLEIPNALKLVPKIAS